MPVSSPARARWRKKPAKALTASLPLAGLIPVLMGLLVYELPLFETSASASPFPRVDLPAARGGADLELAPLLIVTREGVLLDSRLVADATALRGPQPLEELMEDLRTRRRDYIRRHPRWHFNGDILFAANADLSFKEIRRVTGAAHEAGYDRLSFLVRLTAPRSTGSRR